MKLKDLAKNLGLECQSEIEITSLNTLKDAKKDNLSFFENKKYLDELKHTKAAAVLVHEDFKSFVPKGVLALVDNEPYLKLALASKFFVPKHIEEEGENPQIGENTKIMPNVYVGKNTKIGKNCILMSGVFIGDNVSIGDSCVMYPNSVIYRDCILGNSCIVQAGAIIGSDGFGFAHTKEGKHIKIYQNGNVILENNIELGANTTIDRAVFGSTLIKSGTKIDNLVQIGHNCVLDENVIIVGQVGVAGSTKLGRNVVIGGQSGTAGHLQVAAFTTIAARSGLTKSVSKSGETYAGFPARPRKEWLKTQAKISRF